ncbi:hypothetical protein LEP1GSC079_3366 [Leptospira interrogans str. FPW1039]|uniref:Uncharacterized protein n=1 Tax=Leptospira interrogans str. FPW1039 TaxID=1193040 RepID=A0A0F6IDB4_LEPIR|nr:hypothetical protein LEP1GSC079_3366 [Leptospira interrogans str. FPW1039]
MGNLYSKFIDFFLIVQAPALGVGKSAFKSCSLFKRCNLWELLQIWV